MRAPQWLDPADDAGAAAERDNRNALSRAESQNAFHLIGIGGKQNGVGRRLEPARAQAGKVGVASSRSRGGSGPRRR